MPWRPRRDLPWWDRLSVQRKALFVGVVLAGLSMTPWAVTRVRIWAAAATSNGTPAAAEAPAPRVVDAGLDAVEKIVVSNARLTVAPGARVTLPAEDVPADRPVEVRLHRGRLLVDVGPRDPNAPFVVRTPVATAGVRGTRFEVRMPDLLVTEVYVDEGTVEVRGLEGEAVLVSAGEAAFVVDRAPARHVRRGERDASARLGPGAAEPSAAVGPPVSPPGAAPVEAPAEAAEAGRQGPDRSWSRLPGNGL